MVATGVTIEDVAETTSEEESCCSEDEDSVCEVEEIEKVGVEDFGLFKEKAIFVIGYSISKL